MDKGTVWKFLEAGKLQDLATILRGSTIPRRRELGMDTAIVTLLADYAEGNDVEGVKRILSAL